MVGVAIGIALFPRHNDNPDFDRRVSGFHFLEVGYSSLGIGPGVIGSKRCVGINVEFPGAIVFVSDFPIFETVVVRDVGKPNPVGRFVSVTAAVIRSDNGLGAYVGGNMSKIGKTCGPALPS